ncbi:MAG TPA: CDP-alcohol phosphatidyltransferase family protein [Clostridia bacterium]|nr:CDP-alcohol phosphatidyltransferase family protein [Clostridia bacterium]
MTQEDNRQSENASDNNKHVHLVLNIPNTLTLIRFFAIAPLAFMISRWPQHRGTTFIIFLAIWATDFLDGYIARRFDKITEFGKLFDPFVDKVFQVVTAIMMFSVGQIPLWVPLYYVIREFLMLFASTLLLTKRNVVVFSDWLGKIATFFFVAAVAVMFLVTNERGWVRHVVFIPAVFFSLIATINYALKQTDIGKKKNNA